MNTLTIVALSTPQTIGRAALQACIGARMLYLQTEQTPCVLPIREAGVAFSTMDDLYEQAEDFDDLQQAICARLQQACGEGDTVYAVPGRGMGDALHSICAAMREAGVATNVLVGAGYAQAALAQYALCFDRMLIASATALPAALQPDLPLLVEEIDTALRAGEVKLHITEYYPDAHGCMLFAMRPDGTYDMRQIPLYELDRQCAYHATTVLLVPPAELVSLSRFGYRELELVMERLRTPGGCPWDREQTHASLKKSMIEECYEVLDAIDREEDDALCEELGDVLLQCVFHAEIAQKQGRFSGRDVTTGIVQKLIYRHPHIFGDAHADTAEQVLTNWEALKKKEKHFHTQSEVLQAVPKNLPALMRAYKVQKKAAQVGFDWPQALDALLKMEEETVELREACNGKGSVCEEAGDLLFAVVNVVRLLGLEPEELLGAACEKFIGRFSDMEALAAAQGSKLDKMTPAEQNILWEAIKSRKYGKK